MDILMQQLPEGGIPGGAPVEAQAQPAPEQGGQEEGAAAIGEAIQDLQAMAEGLMQRGDPRGEAVMQALQQFVQALSGGAEPAAPQETAPQAGGNVPENVGANPNAVPII